MEWFTKNEQVNLFRKIGEIRTTDVHGNKHLHRSAVQMGGLEAGFQVLYSEGSMALNFDTRISSVWIDHEDRQEYHLKIKR